MSNISHVVAKSRIKAYKFQRKGVRAIQKFDGRCLIADDMGLGKTLQSLIWSKKRRKFPIIVVCPAAVKDNWQREATAVGLTSQQLDGMTADYSLPHTAQVVIINYAILKGWLPWLYELDYQVPIIDECHFIKNKDTQRYKAVKALVSGCEHMLALSGTPCTNRPAELWPVLNLLRPDLWPKFFPFAQRYCDPQPSPYGRGMEYKGATNLKELNKVLRKNVMIRRYKKDVADDLPDKQRIMVPLRLNSYAEYNQASADIIGWLKKTNPEKAKRASRALAIVRINYLRRLAAELKMPYVFDWVDRFLAGSSEKLVLMMNTRKIIDMLGDRYKGQIVTYHGDTSKKRRRQALEQFQGSKRIRIFAATIGAAGTGLDGLQKCCSVGAFIEYPWTPGELNQAADRIYRIGQSRGVQWNYFTALDTIDHKFVELLTEKQDVVDTVLDGSTDDSQASLLDMLLTAI